ncbi:hypothetical protein O5D80_003457 [Batrachochytrium dendrobatidis]|nr:hypothetical protein O5D80_003457 [Batrachochytrium dendrobatidis]
MIHPANEPHSCTVCLEPLFKSITKKKSETFELDKSFLKQMTQQCILPKCSHVFHSVCIIRWLNCGSKRVCPNCREPVKFIKPTLPEIVFLPNGLFWIPLALSTAQPSSSLPPLAASRLSSNTTRSHEQACSDNAVAFLHRDLASKQILIDEMQEEIESLKCDLEDTITDRNHILNDLEHLKAGEHVIKSFQAASKKEMAILQKKLDSLEKINTDLKQQLLNAELSQAASKVYHAKLVETIGRHKSDSENLQRKLAAYKTVESIDLNKSIDNEDWQGRANDIALMDNAADLKDILQEYHRKIQTFHKNSQTYKTRAYEMREERDYARKELHSLKAKYDRLEESHLDIKKQHELVATCQPSYTLLSAKDILTHKSNAGKLINTTMHTSTSCDTPLLDRVAILEQELMNIRKAQLQTTDSPSRDRFKDCLISPSTAVSDSSSKNTHTTTFSQSNQSLHQKSTFKQNISADPCFMDSDLSDLNDGQVVTVRHALSSLDVLRPGAMLGKKRASIGQFEQLASRMKRKNGSDISTGSNSCLSGTSKHTSPYLVSDRMGGVCRQSRPIGSQSDLQNGVSTTATTRQIDGLLRSAVLQKKVNASSFQSKTNPSFTAQSQKGTLLGYFSKKQ